MITMYFAVKREMLLLVVIALSALSFLRIHAQTGFISIDCGYTANASYVDGKTGLRYVGDDGFVDTGLPHSVDMGNLQPDLSQRYSTVRFFPSSNGSSSRNCYTLRPLAPGGKYLVSATFGYGNYDIQNRLPSFRLYLGVDYWTTVRIVNASTAYVFQAIVDVDDAAAGFLQVCLVDIGQGNPFISGLDLRPLQPESLYPGSNATQFLVLLSYFRDTVGFGFNRYHFGDDYDHIRYPQDPYDRIWQRYQLVSAWAALSPNGVVKNPPNDTYHAPSEVMLSVSTLLPTTSAAPPGRMDLGWSTDASMDVDANASLQVLLYFAEVEANASSRRQFDVLLDNATLHAAFTPAYMVSTVVAGEARGPGPHAISLVPTPGSKLPPLISAMEIYLLRPRNESATYSVDVTAAMAIQAKLSVKRNWQGDPCSPVAFSWDGLNCTYSRNGPPRIVALNLSSSGLIGEIDPSFGQLALLQQLDLSHNDLSGPIPDVLGQMASLTFLDLSGNNLNGSIPTSLLKKSRDGGLTLRVDGNPNLCTTYTCAQFQTRPRALIQL